MTGIHAKAPPIMGQEAWVPEYGLGRVLACSPDWRKVNVMTYSDDTPRWFDACNVRLLPLPEFRKAGDWL